MGNISGKAYALTTLSPIRNALVDGEEIACADKVRDIIHDWNMLDNSPMTRVPQTYFCRYFVLDDVYTQSLSGSGALPNEDHLKSKYLVFSSNFHADPIGDVDVYLHGMWNSAGDYIKQVWGYCYGFEGVNDAAGFASYMKKCQLTASLFFVGSNDEPLQEQLKALYLKQQFARFAVDNQGLEAAEIRANYRAFIQRVAPSALSAPTWTPGKYRTWE